MILTGGVDSRGEPRNMVSEYSESGFTHLPQLQQGRGDHGCSYFDNEEGTKVDINCESFRVVIFQTFLVTGGYDGYSIISSTELLTEKTSTWTKTGDLPSPRTSLRGTNIDQRVVMTGLQAGVCVVI